MENTSPAPSQPNDTLTRLQQLELKPLLTARSAPIWQLLATGAAITVGFVLITFDNVVTSLLGLVAISVSVAFSSSYAQYGGVDFGWGKGLPAPIARKTRALSFVTCLVALPLFVISVVQSSWPLAVAAGVIATVGMIGSALWFRSLVDDYVARNNVANPSESKR